MNEFLLIDQFFKSVPIQRKDVVFGIGDDAACLNIPDGNQLLVSTDTLVAGVHFLREWNPFDIAYRALMVNISDMAAMAALPCWITLSLTIEELDKPWLESFSQGLTQALRQFNLDLVGGDTTKGPLSITITILGVAPIGKSIRRCNAKTGDIIMVSGELGAAALAVKLLEDLQVEADDRQVLMTKLLHPNPRIDLMPILRSVASSAIDISDGLSADLNHICSASKVGACLIQDKIPCHQLLNKYLGDQSIDLALSGGDDYEICFTVPPKQLDLLTNELNKLSLVCYPIGVIEEEAGLRIKTANNTLEELKPLGYSHF